ncbi:MAG: TVP38/TMEM64 family protein [Scytonema sp. PMC 1069.18]|nr:TVP38/TMEM64 family protein [Scytonema sp. PMC 1069.18]MEC4885920.1 TVP38/TMEM64 family protein [Scytonema sp. PMC 1070.18]
MYFIGGVEPAKLQVWLKQAGIWAPILYIVIYTMATMLMLPSTALNLTGGAIFGIWLGTLWTSVGALAAAVISFLYSRTVGRTALTKKLSKGWRTMDVEIRKGGMFYIFAIRLLPIIPYGLVNFAAGLTSVSFKDYFLGTVLGTVPGLFPFVLIGSSGLKAVKTGDVLPLIGAFGLVGTLVIGAVWYRNHRF